MQGAGQRVGSTNSFKSTRNQTTAQKRAQNEKAQAKKKANRKAKAEAKTAADRKKNDAIWRSFNAGPNDQLQTGNNNPTGPAPAQQTPEIGLPVNNGGDEDASSSSGSDEPVVITHQVIDPITNSQSAIATNIVPNFDYNEDEAGSDDCIGDDDDMPDDVDGVQQLFLKTVDGGRYFCLLDRGEVQIQAPNQFTGQAAGHPFAGPGGGSYNKSAPNYYYYYLLFLLFIFL